MRLKILAVLLATAASLIVAGAATWSTGAALIFAGVALAGWAWLFFGDVSEPPPADDAG